MMFCFFFSSSTVQHFPDSKIAVSGSVIHKILNMISMTIPLVIGHSPAKKTKNNKNLCEYYNSKYMMYFKNDFI